MDVQTEIALDRPYEYPASKAGIDADFRRFHAANPHVFRKIVALCRRAKARGYDRWSMKGVWEVMRWEIGVETDEEAPKLNNNYTALYARLVMSRCPDLAEFFETRERKAGRS
jgi:hypothetical protein